MLTFRRLKIVCWNLKFKKERTFDENLDRRLQELKVRQYRKQIMVSSILPKKNERNLLCYLDAQDSEFGLFFG